MRTITKIPENGQVVVEETVVTPDRIKREEFNSKVLAIEKINAQAILDLAQARLDLLAEVEAELNNE